MAKRCIRCNVNIYDDAIVCPLCHGVLEDISEGADVSRSSTYPDISRSIKTMQLIIRISIFASILAEALVLVINYLTFSGVYWSLIVGVGLIYGNLTLLYSFRSRKSLQRIIQVQMYLAIILLLALDKILGFTGWSVAYALPILFMSVSATMLVLMIVGIDGWQNYIMTMIATFVASAILLILDVVGVCETSLLAIIAAGVTGFILLGTIMFGQGMISNEIKRRFNV